MDPVRILKKLLERPRSVALVGGVALAASILVGYHVSLVPPKLERRQIESAAATTQLLVDSPRSALGDIGQDTTPLTTRALLFAQFMDSAAFRTLIAAKANVPVSQITTQGPFTSIGVRPNVARSAGVAAAAAGARPYKLVFDAEDNLPVITIYAEGPSATTAKLLADASGLALRSYVSTLQGTNTARADRVVIRSLGQAEGGPINSHARTKLMFMAYLLTLAVGLFVVYHGAWITRDAEEDTEAEPETHVGAMSVDEGRTPSQDARPSRATQARVRKRKRPRRAPVSQVESVSEAEPVSALETATAVSAVEHASGVAAVDPAPGDEPAPSAAREMLVLRPHREQPLRKRHTAT